jgi:DNA-binding MarR family transcriptional regulator
MPVSRSAVSQHLKVLKEAGLVVERKLGRQVRYEATTGALAEAARYLRTMVEAVEGSWVGEGDGEADVPAARKPAMPTDDAIDAAMAHWAEISLKHDPATVATIARLRLVSGLLEDRYAEVAGRFGLNTGEAMILGTLRRLDDRSGMRPSELARASVVAPPSLAKHLGVLERAGLIHRQENPADRRSHRVRLTRKGRDVADAIVEEQLGRHYAALFALPDADRSAMDRALRALMRDLRRYEAPSADR